MDTRCRRTSSRSDGKRSALLTVLRHGGASTLDVVNGVKKLMPAVAATLPSSLRITPLFDQSLFVRASVSGVVREATIAAILTGLMILLFLGSWRSTLIVCLSIPLSILTSLIVLSLLGQTINVMTLGGLASRGRNSGGRRHGGDRKRTPQHGHEGKTLRAILDGAEQIAIPLRCHPLHLHRLCPGPDLRARRNTSLRRSPWPWCLPCSRATSFQERWSR